MNWNEEERTKKAIRFGMIRSGFVWLRTNRDQVANRLESSGAGLVSAHSVEIKLPANNSRTTTDVKALKKVIFLKN